MVREIGSWKKFLEWRAFDKLEPFSPERDDQRAASIVQALWSIARAQAGNSKEVALTDVQLYFGDTPRPSGGAAVQTVEHQERLISDWCFIHNAVVSAKGVH